MKLYNKYTEKNDLKFGKSGSKIQFCTILSTFSEVWNYIKLPKTKKTLKSIGTDTTSSLNHKTLLWVPSASMTLFSSFIFSVSLIWYYLNLFWYSPKLSVWISNVIPMKNQTE